MRIIALLSLLSLTHCAYNWGHGARELPGGHKTVYVEIFKNLSEEPGIEQHFTQALTKELARSGFAIVTSKDAAEIVVSGNVIRMIITGTGSKPGFIANDYANGTANRYRSAFFTGFRVNVTTNIQINRTRDKQLIWQTTINGRDVYLGSILKRQGVRSSNVLYNQSRKKQTIKLIADAMMNEAFDRMTEKF